MRGGASGERRFVALFVVATVAGTVLAARVASGRPILASRWSLLAELGLWALAWLVAVAAGLRIGPRLATVLILGAALAVRLAALAGPPTTSDDLYRYAWDGRVEAAGIDPYSLPPASPPLVRLREGWLWPDPVGCAALHRPGGCTRINRPTVRTIYPPVAEAWFAGVYRLAGIGARHKAWQLAGLVTDMGVVVLLLQALRRWQRDPRWAVLYALSPAPVLEIVNNAHVDGLAILFVVAALTLPSDRLPVWWRDVAAGVLIGAAALVKVYPALLVVAFVGGRHGRRLPTLLRVGLSAAALSVVTYLPHVVAAGTKVLGYLPGYLREEHYQGGGRFLLAGALGVPGWLAGPVSAAALVGAVTWVVVRRPPTPVGAAALLGALLLATSPVQPWYAVALVAVAAVAGRPEWAGVAVAGYPYFFGVILDYRHVVGLGRACYGAALLTVGVAAVLRHRRGPVAPDRGSRSCDLVTIPPR